MLPPVTAERKRHDWPENATRMVAAGSLRAADKLFLLDEIALAAFDIEQATDAVAWFVGANQLPVAEHQFAEFVAVNKDVFRRLLPTATRI
jgi:hypothetical protein